MSRQPRVQFRTKFAKVEPGGEEGRRNPFNDAARSKLGPLETSSFLAHSSFTFSSAFHCKGIRRARSNNLGTPTSFQHFSTLGPLCLSRLREYRDRYWTSFVVSLMHAFLLATPTPLYYTHVAYIELNFDPRSSKLAQQFSWSQGALFTHSEMANWLKARSERMEDPFGDETINKFEKDFGQEAIMEREGPMGIGSVVVPFVLSGLARESEGQKQVLMVISGTAEIDMPVKTTDHSWLKLLRRLLSREGRARGGGGAAGKWDRQRGFA